MVVDGLLMEGRSQKLASQPRERERDLSGVKTTETAEGNEVICNKSNYFEKNLIHSCFCYGEIREGNPEERSESPAVALSPSWDPSWCDSLRAPSGERSLFCLCMEKHLGFPHFKSISGLSEGAGLKVITAPLFPLINYMNNI